MSSLEEHEAEQAAITAACEAGACHHPHCHFDDAKARAEAILRETKDHPDEYPPNERAAARVVTTLWHLNDMESAPKDFMSDIMHFCDLTEVDFEDVLDAARRNYQDEVAALGPARDDPLRQLLEDPQ